jgi:folate-binding protein YgfZ
MFGGVERVTGVLYAPLPNRTLVGLHGEDAWRFLQALVTQDLKLLSPERALYALLLSPQGRFMFDFFILQAKAGLWLDVHKDDKSGLLLTLKRYCLRQTVSFDDMEGSYRLFGVFGDAALDALKLPPQRGHCLWGQSTSSFVDPRLAELGGRVIVKSGEPFRLPGAIPGSLSDYRAHQITLGVPDHNALEREKSIPLEYGLHTLGAIAQDKGCYVGQELIARTLHRGQVRKHVFPAKVQGPTPHHGDLVYTDQGERVGRVVDVFGDKALILGYITSLVGVCQSQSLVEVRRGADRVCMLRPCEPSWMNSGLLDSD